MKIFPGSFPSSFGHTVVISKQAKALNVEK
jgi:hypothetical protein